MKHLLKLADSLDRLGLFREADQVDQILKSAQQPLASAPQLMTTPIQTLVQQAPSQVANPAHTQSTLQAMKNALNLLRTSYASAPGTQHAMVLTKIINELASIPGVR